MYDDMLKQEMVDALEENGEIRITDGLREVYIQSFEDDDNMIYISNSNKEFEDASEAIEWVIDHFGGLENIEEWE